MWRCPVCENKNTGLQCSRCGFDGSCDYEHYPSLGEISSGVDAISRRREALQEQWADTLCCPSCGSGQFRFDVGKQVFICADCGTRIPLPEDPGTQKKKEEPSKSTTDTQTPPVHLGSRIRSVAEPALRFVRRPKRTRLEVILLWLGWISLPMLLLDGVMESYAYGIEWYLVSGILLAYMQFHLLKNGFSYSIWMKILIALWSVRTVISELLREPKKGLSDWLLWIGYLCVGVPLSTLILCIPFCYFGTVFIGGSCCLGLLLNAFFKIMYGNMEGFRGLYISIFGIYAALWHLGQLINKGKTRK